MTLGSCWKHRIDATSQKLGLFESFLCDINHSFAYVLNVWMFARLGLLWLCYSIDRHPKEFTMLAGTLLAFTVLFRGSQPWQYVRPPKGDEPISIRHPPHSWLIIHHSSNRLSITALDLKQLWNSDPDSRAWSSERSAASRVTAVAPCWHYRPCSWSVMSPWRWLKA